MRAKVELVGRRIEVLTSEPYSGLNLAVPGAYWRERSKRWSLPLGMAVCRNLRQVFGRNLEIGPRLTAWAKAEVLREDSQRALGRSLAGVGIPGVEDASPRLAQALRNRPYQTAAARFIAEGRSVLVADTPGLGKTTETIAGIVEAGVPGPYLIAAPAAAVTDAWEREILARLGDLATVITVTGSKTRRMKLLDGIRSMTPEKLASTWVIVNIEMLRTKVWWVCPECEKINVARRAEPIQPEEPELKLCQERWEASDKPKSGVVDCGHNPRNVRTDIDHQYPQLFERQWGALVMDECQRILLRNTGKSTQTRKGAMLLETIPDGLRIALSGTPMRGKPQRLWGVLNWLRRDVFSGFWPWVERFWHVDSSGYGGAREIKGFQLARKAAFDADLDRYMIRRTKAEVSPELPAKAYMGTPLNPLLEDSPVAVWIPMLPEQQRAYYEMLASGSAWVEDGKLQAVGVLAELTRLKQFANCYGKMNRDGSFSPALPSNKWEWLKQFLLERNICDLKDRDEPPDSKVVIVSQFTSILNLIERELRAMGVPISMVTGDVTGPTRQRLIDAFNNPNSGHHVMLLNTQAGGVGLTLDAADDMVFLDETHVPDDQEQAEGRIDNRRPEDKVAQRRYWYLKSLGSVDEAIAQSNLARDKSQKEHLDGRRGLEYSREVFATMRELAEKGSR